MVCELYHNEKKRNETSRWILKQPLPCVPEVFRFKMLLTMPSNIDSIEASMAATDIFFKGPASSAPKPQSYSALRW